MSVALEKERRMGLETTVLEREYKLPTGETIFVGNERFEAPEILMKPYTFDPDMGEEEGLADMIYSSICKCDLDL